MKIEIQALLTGRVKDEIIAAGIFEKARALRGAARDIDGLAAGIISEVVRKGDFTGTLHQTMVLYAGKGLQCRRILLVGLGKEKEFTLDRLRGASAAAARAVRDMRLRRFTMPLSFADAGGSDSERMIGAMVEGILLGLYKFREFQTTGKDGHPREVETCRITLDDTAGLRAARVAAKHAETVAVATILARNLVSRPGNCATPAFLAQTARAIAKKHGLVCRVLDQGQAGRLGMGAFLSVAQGSDAPARFIILEHRPKLRTKVPTIVLVGKAITFDSGGISLKPAKDMDEMKTDMAGGAAVLGALQACAQLRLPIHVVGLVPATENLPSGHALKPGDIIKAMSGKTIEIISTDAEGRLILADALTYAQRYKPAAIIDLATLTGACIIALGNDVAGVMGNNDDLVKRIKDAAVATNEKVWQLPLWDEYRELLKSDIADMKNVGGRSAGTITAGYFLKEFVGKTPWAHLDIAGTAWTKQSKPYMPKGATGFGVRLMVSMLERWTT
jgi:leucyl aminopeptidase